MLGWTCRTLLLCSALLALGCDAFLPKSKWGPCEAKNPFGPGFTEGTCMRLIKCKDTLRGIVRLNFPVLCGVEILSTIVCCPIMKGDEGGPAVAENRGPSIVNPLNLLGDVFQNIPGIGSSGIVPGNQIGDAENRGPALGNPLNLLGDILQNIPGIGSTGIGGVNHGGGQGNFHPNSPQRPDVIIPDQPGSNRPDGVYPGPPQHPQVPGEEDKGVNRPDGVNPGVPPHRPQGPGQNDKGGSVPGGQNPTPPLRPQVPSREDKDGGSPGRPCRGLQCPTEDGDDIIHLIDPRKGKM